MKLQFHFDEREVMNLRTLKAQTMARLDRWEIGPTRLTHAR